MKLLLISTTIEDESRSPVIMDNSHYPLGLAYIHSYLEQCGHTVKTLFLNDYDYGACLRITISELNSFEPDFVGIQLISHNRVSGFKTIELIHERYPCIKLFIGGIHTTILYEQILM